MIFQRAVSICEICFCVNIHWVLYLRNCALQMSRLGFDVDAASSKWQPKSMSLSTIPNQKRRVRHGRQTNRTDDISGATTTINRYTTSKAAPNRPELHSTLDIAGAQPKKLHGAKRNQILTTYPISRERLQNGDSRHRAELTR